MPRHAPPPRPKAPRELLNAQLMNLYRPYMQTLGNPDFSGMLRDRYAVAETRLLTVEQLADLVEHLTAGIAGGNTNPRTPRVTPIPE